MVVVLALVLLALAITGAAAIAVLRGQLLNRVDEQLQSSVVGVINQQNGNARGFGPAPSLPQTGAAFYAGIFDADGNAVSTPMLRVPYGQTQSAPRLPTITYTVAQARQGEPFTASAVSDRNDWRVLVQPVLVNGQPGSIAVALNLRDVRTTTNQLIGVEAIVSLLVLLLLAGVAYTLVRTSLRRLVAVEQTAGAIAAGDLSQRVPVLDSRTEVGRLGLALNAMLSQIERAFRDREASESSARASEDRMRRFVADASHELRTPLTSIRGFAELHRQGAVNDPEAVARILGRIEGEAQRMGLLVDDLLLLARLDQQRPLEQKPVDLLILAADAVADAGTLAPGRPVRLITSGLEDAPPVVTGDEARLRQVLGNLVSNALRYTPAGSPVAVRVAVEGSDALLEVIDSGPGLAPEDAQRVFERFYRADPSRTRAGRDVGPSAGGGSGLGLSIVAALVAAHGGTVRVQTSVGAGATFTVRLPLRDDVAAPSH
ncbi:MAG TPA: HAMP domain-containing sensor histidine kinase [Frankiaceae bacterium]|nr:HAMP domain-containing sensor histidine kinase [Frankiaceae bacterium]